MNQHYRFTIEDVLFGMFPSPLYVGVKVYLMLVCIYKVLVFFLVLFYIVQEHSVSLHPNFPLSSPEIEGIESVMFKFNIKRPVLFCSIFHLTFLPTFLDALLVISCVEVHSICSPHTGCYSPSVPPHCYLKPISHNYTKLHLSFECESVFVCKSMCVSFVFYGPGGSEVFIWER